MNISSKKFINKTWNASCTLVGAFFILYSLQAGGILGICAGFFLTWFWYTVGKEPNALQECVSDTTPWFNLK